MSGTDSEASKLLLRNALVGMSIQDVSQVLVEVFDDEEQLEQIADLITTADLPEEEF